MSESSQSVIDRILKLLALANDGRGNENEMRVAAEMAAKLLREHNLSVADLEAKTGQRADARREKSVSDYSAKQEWARHLMYNIASANFCVWRVGVVWTRSSPNRPVRKRERHVLIGRPENVAATLAVYEFLLSSMDRLMPFGDRKSREANSWFYGCAVRVVERLSEERAAFETLRRRQAEEAARGGNALVLVDDYAQREADENRDFIRGVPPGTTAAERAKAIARMEEEARSQSTDVARAETLDPKETERRRKLQEKWARQARREQEKRSARINWDAFHSGSAVGSTMPLQRQVR